MKQVITDKKLLMKKSINRACRKERFAGFLYFLGTLAMTVAMFFPLVTDVIFSKSGDLNVTNFWEPILEIMSLKTSVFAVGMNFFTGLLYAFILVFCVINTLYSLAKLDALYIKGNKKIGFNQNAIAMEKLGRTFSSTFVALAFLMFFTHMFLGTRPTTLFYIVTAGFMFIHFWAGIVGAKASRFTARDGIQEFPRTKGRLAPFIRNVMQFVFIGGILYFIFKANIINNLIMFFNVEYAGEVFGNLGANLDTFISGFVNPLLQLLICIFSLVLVVHATNITEWNKDGGKGKGMKTFRVFSLIICLCALAFNGLHLYMNLAFGWGAISMQMIYVAVIALAAFIAECCMSKLPGEKKKGVESAEPVDDIEETPVLEETPAVAQEQAQIPAIDPAWVANIKFIDAPGVYMQPNGVPVMVMPLVQEESTDEAQAEEQASVAEGVVAEQAEESLARQFATPVGINALARAAYKKAIKEKWLARAKGSPEEVEEAPAKPRKKPSDAEDVLELGEEKKVKCPHCGKIVWAQEGAPAYICPECGEKFSFKKAE